jgi:hypothetical protein
LQDDEPVDRSIGRKVNAMMMQPRPCPHCQFPNTARTADGVAVCFNCRATWDPSDPEGSLKAPGRRAAPVPEPPPYAFSPAQLARLRVYREAVRAGFYNEGQPARPIAA